MKYTSIIAIIIVIGSITLVGCSNNSTSINQTPPEDSTVKKAVSHNKPVINSEEEFILQMIPHHQEAIDSATIILQKSQYTKLKGLAQNIVDAQTKEVSMMQGWLKDRYPSSIQQVEYMQMMDKNLGNLEGNTLDEAFISGMIKHHQGAIMMAQLVLEISQKPEIVQMANDIITTQTTEIEELDHLLEDIGQPEHSD